MTKTYAALRLLALGPLTFGEVVEITGWKRNRCNNVLIQLRKQGYVRRQNIDGKSCYRIV